MEQTSPEKTVDNKQIKPVTLPSPYDTIEWALEKAGNRFHFMKNLKSKFQYANAYLTSVVTNESIERIMCGGKQTELINMNVRVDGKKAVGILDTGATASCCSPDLAMRLSLEILPDNTPIMQVDTVTYPLGIVNTKVRVEGIEIEAKLYVIKNLDWDLLVGLDIGRQFKLIIFLEDMRVELAPQVILKTLTNTERPWLETQEEERTKNLLKKHRKIFSKNESDIGCFPGVKHEIHTTSTLAIAIPPYQTRPENEKEIERQTRLLLENDLIRVSKSPWSASVTLQNKSDGSKRLCVDYRRLNSITISNKAPMPLILDIFDKLRDAKLFTTLDIASGFWHIKMHEDSISKTGFSTKNGHYEWTVMPFGLKNAPATFQTAVQLIIREWFKEGVINYADDIVIYTETFNEHVQLLDKLLKKLDEHNVKLKEKKCSFFQEAITYLGHEIKFNEIRPSDKKTLAVKDFPIPDTVKKVQSFLGLAGHYRRFIKDFSKIAIPLYKLTKKDTPFEWGDEQKRAFEILKQKLTEEPVLILYDPENRCYLYTDACKDGIGGILSQRDTNGKDHVVAYFSKKTKTHEQNYGAMELECLAIITCTRHFEHYLQPGFVIRTDHQALQWLKTVSGRGGKLLRWAGELSTLEFNLEYRPGKAMQHADALSRSPITIRTIRFTTEDLKDEKDKGETLAERFEENGIIFTKRKNRKVAYVPNSRREKLIYNYHDGMSHPGMTKVTKMIREHYWWPKMEEEIREYVRTCVACQIVKVSRLPKEGHMGDPPVPLKPMEIVGLDTIDLAAIDRNAKYKYLQVFVDHFSRFVWAYPTNKNNAETIKKALISMINSGFKPEKILSDNATNFKANSLENFLNENGIEHTYSTTYHPQTNGNVERFNDTIMQKIRIKLFERPKLKWSTVVQDAVKDYNDTPHSATTFEPRYILTGLNNKPSFASNVRNITEDRKIAHTKNVQTQKKRKEAFNAKHVERTFKEGDLVLRKIPANLPTRSKVGPRNEGPFVVKKALNKQTYLIQHENEEKPPFRIHNDQMQRFYKRKEHTIDNSDP